MGISITGVGAAYPTQDIVGERVHPVSSPAHETEVRPERTELSRADIESTAVNLERITLAFNKKLKFIVDSNLEEVIVKVIDPETDKVIKELPPKELQALHLKLKEMIGLLFDEIA
jgi:flagellar protein FlaG